MAVGELSILLVGSIFFVSEEGDDDGDERVFDVERDGDKDGSLFMDGEERGLDRGVAIVEDGGFSFDAGAVLRSMLGSDIVFEGDDSVDAGTVLRSMLLEVVLTSILSEVIGMFELVVGLLVDCSWLAGGS